MRKFLLLGLVLTVVFVTNLIMYPVTAGSINEFTATTKSDSEDIGVRITTTADIPKDGGIYFGYGILTEESFPNAILVTMTHGGILDSAEQYGIDDPEWHNHYVALSDDVDNACPGLEITDMSYASPGDVRVYGEKATFDGPKVFNSFNLLNGVENSYKGGQTILAVISFDLIPVFDDDGSITNVCVDVNGLFPIK